MIQTVCKEHDWVEIFTYLGKKIIDTNYQCRLCGIIKVKTDFKIQENLEVINNGNTYPIANVNSYNAEVFYSENQ